MKRWVVTYTDSSIKGNGQKTFTITIEDREVKDILLSALESRQSVSVDSVRELA